MAAPHAGKNQQAIALEPAEKSIAFALLPPHLGQKGVVLDPVPQCRHEREGGDDVVITAQLANFHARPPRGGGLRRESDAERPALARAPRRGGCGSSNRAV